MTARGEKLSGKLLVFGKTGQVATELARSARSDCAAGPRAILQATFLGRDDGVDMARPETCAAAIAAHAPDVVINAAAWTAVDAAETQEAAAHVVNADSPGAMAQACAAREIPFLHISTDYVFDGSGDRPWRPTDPVAPQNAYGRTKLAGEEAVRAAGGQAAILRTSWVFSAHGSNFVKTMLGLSQRLDQLSIVADEIGGPTPAADIAAALMRMAALMQAGQAGGVYHFAGQPFTSWKAFACESFSIAGRQVRVTPLRSADWAAEQRATRPYAARPLNSRLDCTTLAADFGITQPDWKAGLRAVLAELGERHTANAAEKQGNKP